MRKGLDGIGGCGQGMLQIVFVLLSLFKIRSRYLCRLWEIKILPFVNVQNGTSHVALVVKSLLPMQETQETGLIPGSGRSPGVGNGNQFQYSCLENSMDKGAWWAAVHGATKNQTQRSTAQVKE